LHCIDAVLLVPPLGFFTIPLVYLMPSIRAVYQERHQDLPVALKYFISAGDFFASYWWLLLIPVVHWLLIHAYGRLVFLLGLIKDESDPLLRNLRTE
jgi:type II secretory pathway component PulF